MDGTAAAKTHVKERGALYTATVTALPAAAALTSGWLYQYGRATYFNIPLGVITVRVSDICLALSVLALCALASGTILAIGNAVETPERFVMLLTMYTLFTLGAVLAIGFGGMEERTLSPVLLTSAVTTGVLAVLLMTKGLRTKTARPRAGLVVSLGVLIMALSNFGLGLIRAWSQAYFYVVRSHSSMEPDLVALGLYGDLIVLSPLDADSNQLKPTFVIRSLSDGITADRIHFPHGIKPAKPVESTELARKPNANTQLRR
jgi:hypothetical protein